MKLSFICKQNRWLYLCMNFDGRWRLRTGEHHKLCQELGGDRRGRVLVLGPGPPAHCRRGRVLVLGPGPPAHCRRGRELAREPAGLSLLSRRAPRQRLWHLEQQQ